MKALYSLKEYARILRVSHHQVKRWADAGTIPGVVRPSGNGRGKRFVDVSKLDDSQRRVIQDFEAWYESFDPSTVRVGLDED